MLISELENIHVILASKSPRRQELLKGLEIDFEIRTKDVEEVYGPELKREEIPVFLSELKAAAFKDELKEDELLITSDTTVHLGNRVLEKPKSRDEAIAMLEFMSGQKHIVITAVCLSSKTKSHSFFDETEVYFAELNREEIEHYIDTYKPFDKAGSYGVQELIGYMGIEKIHGSFYNVMGLPLQKLYVQLKAFYS